MLHTGRNGERWAPTIFMQCPLNAGGMIRAVYLVMTTRKLGRVLARVARVARVDG